MKPVKTMMKKNITNLIVASAALLMAQGCTKDDLSVCGVDITFKYDMNMDYADKFGSDVDKINLFVFDSLGFFVSEHEQEFSNPNHNQMHLLLEPGVYDFVAWGNLDTDAFSVTQQNAGTTRRSNMRVGIKSSGGEVVNCPGKLFHGSINRVRVKRLNNGTNLVSLIKNTNAVKVTATGLPYTVNSNARASVEPEFTLRVTSQNGEYDNSNTLTSNSTIRYTPQYDYSGQSRSTLVSNFNVLRLYNNESCGTRIVVTHTQANGAQQEIFNESVTGLILQADSNIDFDRKDSFEIEIGFDHTYTVVSIIVDGYVIVDSSNNGGVLG